MSFHAPKEMLLNFTARIKNVSPNFVDTLAKVGVTARFLTIFLASSCNFNVMLWLALLFVRLSSCSADKLAQDSPQEGVGTEDLVCEIE